MRSITARCPAKINLGLHVAGRRPDGFHEIVTLFQAVDLWDTLTVEPDAGLSLEVDDPTIPGDETNLVMRAARLLQSRVAAAAGRGARLRLSKSIPAGGGLGGGSSDAAGALVALDALWGLELGSSRRSALAAELGSDVPFFLGGGTALGTGRGERIEPLPPIAERPLVLGMPPFGLSTAEVYCALSAPLTPSGPGVNVPRLFVKLAEQNDFALATNDLEAPAFTMRAELAAFRDAVSRSGAEVALLSGSGSTVFGMFGAGADVQSVAARLRVAFPDWTLRVSRTVASGVLLRHARGGE